MQAIGLYTYGGPDVLTLVDLPEPHAAEGEVRVRVRAAALNPADVMLRDGSLAAIYEGLAKPYVPGMDVAGVIDEVGPGIDTSCGLQVGQDVVGIVDNTGAYGGYAEYVTLPAASVTAAPTGASPVAAASFLMNALTAQNALDTLDLRPGPTLLVTGAAGAVGGYAVPLARAAGLRVIGVAAESDRDYVGSLGADAFIPRGEGLVARILDVAPGGVDAVIDGATLYERVVGAVRDGGAFGDLRFWDAAPGRGITVEHLNVRERARDRDAIRRMRELVEGGTLQMRVAEVFPFAEVRAAHARLDEGHLRGRIILDLDA